MLKNPVEVTEKAEEGTYIFSFGIGKGPAYKGKITAENKSVAVKNIYSFFIFAHAMIITRIRKKS